MSSAEKWADDTYSERRKFAERRYNAGVCGICGREMALNDLPAHTVYHREQVEEANRLDTELRLKHNADNQERLKEERRRSYD